MLIRLTVHPGGEATEAESRPSRSHRIHSEDHWCSACFGIQSGSLSTGWCCYLGGSSHLSKTFLEKLVKMINCDNMLRVGDKEPFLGPLGAQESGVGATDSSDISVQHLEKAG